MDEVQVAQKRWEDAVSRYGQDSPQAKEALWFLEGAKRQKDSGYSSVLDRIWPDNAWHLLGISGPGKKGPQYRADVSRADGDPVPDESNADPLADLPKPVRMSEERFSEFKKDFAAVLDGSRENAGAVISQYVNAGGDRGELQPYISGAGWANSPTGPATPAPAETSDWNKDGRVDQNDVFVARQAYAQYLQTPNEERDEGVQKSFYDAYETTAKAAGYESVDLYERSLQAGGAQIDPLTLPDGTQPAEVAASSVPTDPETGGIIDARVPIGFEDEFVPADGNGSGYVWSGDSAWVIAHPDQPAYRSDELWGDAAGRAAIRQSDEEAQARRDRGEANLVKVLYYGNDDITVLQNMTTDQRTAFRREAWLAGAYGYDKRPISWTAANWTNEDRLAMRFLMGEANKGGWTWDQTVTGLADASRPYGKPMNEDLIAEYDEFRRTNRLERASSMSEAEKALRDIVSSYGLEVTDDWVAGKAAAIVDGRTTSDAVQEKLLEKFVIPAFPGWEEQLRSGSTISDLASPYMATAANMLGINQNTITTRDKFIQQAMQGVDGKPLTMWQFQDLLKDDPRWLNSANVWEQVGSIAERQKSWL
jgi:hypothetical protein